MHPELRDQDITERWEPVGYVDRISRCRTLTGLLGVLAQFRLIANDAYETARGMNDQDFEVFQNSVALARQGKDPEPDVIARFGVLYMPEVMFMVSLTAEHYSIPWGAAYRQMRTMGVIRVDDGIATVVAPSDSTEQH